MDERDCRRELLQPFPEVERWERATIGGHYEIGAPSATTNCDLRYIYATPSAVTSSREFVQIRPPDSSASVCPTQRGRTPARRQPESGRLPTTRIAGRVFNSEYAGAASQSRARKCSPRPRGPNTEPGLCEQARGGAGARERLNDFAHPLANARSRTARVALASAPYCLASAQTHGARRRCATMTSALRSSSTYARTRTRFRQRTDHLEFHA